MAKGSQEICCCGIPQLCDSRGGRPGPNSPCGLCGPKATLNTLQSSGAVWGKKVSNVFLFFKITFELSSVPSGASQRSLWKQD